MSTNILGFTLGGENARIKDAQNEFAIKFPVSGDVNALRQNLGRAIIELGDLKSQDPDTSGGKRIQQRNITALTKQTINLQNAINDSSLYMGNYNNNYTLKLPTAKLVLFKSPYDSGTNNTTNPPLVQQPIKKAKNVRGLDKPIKEEVVDNTDGGEPQVGAQPQGASGNYPPPQGTQGTNYGKWLGIVALVAGIGTLGYVFLNKKK